MNTVGKIGIGVGIVGAITAVVTLVVKLVNGNKEEKPVAAGTTDYCTDDEVQKVEGWETSRNNEL